MKRFFLFFFVSCLLFLGCGKDDKDSNSSTSSFTYKSNTYSLAKGFTIGWGESNSSNVYTRELYLVSSGISCTSSSSDYVISGIGNSLYFNLYTSSESGIAAGTYTYNEYDTYPILNTFDFCEVDLNSDWDAETTGEWAEITEGTLTVEKSGTTYVINFDGYDSNSNRVTASYTGTLSNYNMSNNKKTPFNLKKVIHRK